MARTVNIHNIAVVMGTLVCIAHFQRDGSTGGPSPEHAGQDFHLVPFLSGRGKLALARLSPVQIGLDVPFLQRQSGRAAVHHHADSLSMGFSPGRHSQYCSQCRTCHILSPVLLYL